jgi:isocitrate lyase
MSIEAEQKAFMAEVEQVEAWWRDDRWRWTKRPFTAEAIVSKRGNLVIQYPSNVQSKKLWNILEERFEKKEASATYGCLDPVMVSQMAKYLDTVYVTWDVQLERSAQRRVWWPCLAGSFKGNGRSLIHCNKRGFARGTAL